MGAASHHLSAEELRGIALQVIPDAKERSGEIWGACPWHQESTPGGSFSYNPAKDAAGCFGCGNHGDLIEVFAAVHGLSNKDAFREFFGKYCPGALQRRSRSRARPLQMPREYKPVQAGWRPVPEVQPNERWVAKAGKLVSWCAGKLLENRDALAWLSARGIDQDLAQRFHLGWCPGERGGPIFRQRSAWGLPDKTYQGRVVRALRIQPGLTIPRYIDGRLFSVRIRTTSGQPKYDSLPLPDEAKSPNFLALSTSATSRHQAAVVVESELDALLVHQVAGDIVHAVALGSSGAKPRARTAEVLQECLAVLLALDFDQAGTGAASWWLGRFDNAVEWPVPSGKDPSEAYQAGVDLRSWILSGLPPVFAVLAKQSSKDEPPKDPAWLAQWTMEKNGIPAEIFPDGTVLFKGNGSATIRLQKMVADSQLVAALFQEFVARDRRVVHADEVKEFLRSVDQW